MADTSAVPGAGHDGSTSIVNVHIFQFANAVTRSTLTSAAQTRRGLICQMRLVTVITTLRHRILTITVKMRVRKPGGVIVGRLLGSYVE